MHFILQIRKENISLNPKPKTMIKLTIGESTTQEKKPFPKLMIREKEGKVCIILASEKVKDTIYGICLKSDFLGDQMYEYSMAWNAMIFTDFNEPITIQNL